RWSRPGADGYRAHVARTGRSRLDRVRADPARDRSDHAPREQRDRKHARARARALAREPRTRRLEGRAGRSRHAFGRALRRANPLYTALERSAPLERGVGESLISNRARGGTQRGPAREGADYTTALACCAR